MSFSDQIKKSIMSFSFIYGCKQVLIFCINKANKFKDCFWFGLCNLTNLIENFQLIRFSSLILSVSMTVLMTIKLGSAATDSQGGRTSLAALSMRACWRWSEKVTIFRLTTQKTWSSPINEDEEDNSDFLTRRLHGLLWWIWGDVEEIGCVFLLRSHFS